MTPKRNETLFTGNVSEVVILLLPLALMTFSSSSVIFVEKLFFARLSAETIEVALNVNYVCRIFQAPCLALAMMAQVYVGRQYGAREEQTIGNHVWQFIWFSLLSMSVTVPLSVLYGHLYFEGTILEQSAMPYFYFLVLMNFLYPLGASLSCFFIGLGKTRFVLVATLAAHFSNLMLVYLLVFGVEGWIPAFGLIGGAISFMTSQGLFCLVLLAIFLSPKHATAYGTHRWHFHPKLFWECVYPGLMRALNRVSVFLCWASIARLMIAKEGEYLLIWSIGGTMTLFLPFIGDAVCQALTTINSHLVGAKNSALFGKLDRCACVILVPIIGLMAIPMVGFPGLTFHAFFPELSLADASVSKLFLGLWLGCTYWTFSYIPASRILAFKDASFFLFMSCLSWITCFFLMYTSVHIVKIPADQCWIILSFSNLADLAVYSWRSQYLTKHRQIILERSLQMPSAQRNTLA